MYCKLAFLFVIQIEDFIEFNLICLLKGSGGFSRYAANVYRQRTDKLLFLYAIITHENV